MKRFQPWPLLMILVLVLSHRRNVVAFEASGKGTGQAGRQVFRPRFTGQAPRQFVEKRRVPTGSNPLHNSGQKLIKYHLKLPALGSELGVSS
ncbi:hypothetical protein F3Y22_tig00110926pilonHSYRG00031 [Hibiscus syriacus]|uniref:Uncharacterized protein n=1 Tax=Hibiscus syriacus TaxID=106335 RepID=A0A6A2ZDL1_HIBSY|nr:hypothetical protein F3Y22_tig00110926pilonHSYRG00031 [Hibiscus syriacus]